MAPSEQCSGNNRTIPEDVRRALRTEANFGCPVTNCGSPYLTYHHFDPPFHLGRSHEVEGMIAMCLSHHRMADVGTWSDDQLREMKRRPFLTGGQVGGRLEWLRRDVLVEAGGNMALNPGVVLAVGGQRVIWTTRSSDGSLRFNLNIIDHTGETLLHLEDNEWVVTGPVLDVRAAASAHDIRVASGRDPIP